MAKTYRDLGPYSDLVAAAAKDHRLWPGVKPGESTRRRLLDSLRFQPRDPKPLAVKVEGRWERDGLVGEAISWSVGYGPRTQAWVVKPAGVQGKLPGVLALHDHGGFKFIGKEKIADGPEPLPQWIAVYRDMYYAGRPWANELARQGFVVLVHDTFLWGSRKVPYETMSAGNRDLAEIFADKVTREGSESFPNGIPREVGVYNLAAGFEENTVEKYAAALGTTMAGMVNFDDRVAVNYLLSRKDVSGKGVGAIGLSGGGMRTVLLQATTREIAAAVVAGAMTTYAGLLDHNVVSHTWMVYPAGWPAMCDWSDAVAARAPSPLMVQYDEEDQLYTPEGQKAAHRRIAAHYKAKGKPRNYIGEFYPGPHKFDLPMQESAFAFLARSLGK